MSTACKYLLCASILQLCLNGTAYADDITPSSYPEILVDDVKHAHSHQHADKNMNGEILV